MHKSCILHMGGLTFGKGRPAVIKNGTSLRGMCSGVSWALCGVFEKLVLRGHEACVDAKYRAAFVFLHSRKRDASNEKVSPDLCSE